MANKTITSRFRNWKRQVKRSVGFHKEGVASCQVETERARVVWAR